MYPLLRVNGFSKNKEKREKGREHLIQNMPNIPGWPKGRDGRFDGSNSKPDSESLWNASFKGFGN